jgi:cyclase
MLCSRRSFLALSALTVAAGRLPRAAVSAGAMVGEFTPLRRGVGLFTARGGTIGWLVNSAGSIVVDSQFPDTARDCAAGLAGRGAAAVDALINTHHHGDHTGGNEVFRPLARRIVAHRRAVALQRAVAEAGGNASAQVYADTTFADCWTVAVGDETVRATHYGAAHTGGDAVVTFQQAEVVHLGDLVFNRAYPFIDRPGGASVRGWIGTLEAVVAEHPAGTLYVFGHGRPEFGVTGSREDVLLQRDFLSAVLEAAQRSLAAGRSREEATRPERLPAFPDHEALVPRLNLAAALGAAYDEISEAG